MAVGAQYFFIIIFFPLLFIFHLSRFSLICALQICGSLTNVSKRLASFTIAKKGVRKGSWRSFSGRTLSHGSVEISTREKVVKFREFFFVCAIARRQRMPLQLLRVREAVEDCKTSTQLTRARIVFCLISSFFFYENAKTGKRWRNVTLV